MATRGEILHAKRNLKAWNRFNKALFKLKRDNKRAIDRALMAAGKFLADKIKQGIREGAPGGIPLLKNARSTIRRKGGRRRPLIDTGTLLGSIKAHRVRRGLVAVGILANLPHPDTRRTVARIGAFHEFGFRHRNMGTVSSNPLAGARAGPLLRRAFIAPTLEKHKNQIAFTIWAKFGRDFIRILKPLRPPVVRGKFFA